MRRTETRRRADGMEKTGRSRRGEGGRGNEEGNKAKWKRAREEKGKEDVERLIEGEEGDCNKCLTEATHHHRLGYICKRFNINPNTHRGVIY